MKRGHSNVHVGKTQVWTIDGEPNADVAKIPLEGGFTAYTVKELPPLALKREEWEEIGQRMNWSKPKRAAGKEQPK